jgi:hypothetical protein
MDCGLAGGVAATDHEHLLTLHGLGLEAAAP